MENCFPMTIKLSATALRSTLVAAFFAATVAGASAAAYVWNFDSFDLSIAPGSSSGEMNYRGNTAPLTNFEITGSTYPNINGQPARYLRHDAWPTPAANDTTLGYDLTFAASGPNGGGAFINQYTFVIDILVPPALDYVPIFQTNPDNAKDNDADWYIAPDGTFGIGALGYTTVQLTTDTWYRLGFVADLGANDVRYYLNGSLVFTTTATGLLDGRFSIDSNLDDGPDLVLFNENDTSGNYTHAGLYNSIAFFDQALTSAQMSAFGGPSAAGIPVPEPTVLFTLLAGASALLLLRRRGNCQTLN
jgi:hypothetical protein